MKLVASNNFSKKLHYILKYLVLALPMLLLLISCLIPKKNINNNYSVLSSSQTDTTISFNQQVNLKNAFVSSNINADRYNDYTLIFNRRITSSSIYTITRFDVVAEHKYLFISNQSFSSNLNSSHLFGLYNTNIYLNTISLNDINYCILNANGDLLSINFVGDSDTTTIYNLKVNLFDLTSMGLSEISINDFLELFPLVYYSFNDGQDIMLSTLVNNVGDNVLTSNEVRTYNDEIISPIMTFYEMPLNNFYFDLLDTIGIVYTNEIVKYLLCYVLWIMYVYLFDLIADIFAFIPKILHNLAYKIGGDD